MNDNLLFLSVFSKTKNTSIYMHDKHFLTKSILICLLLLLNKNFSMENIFNWLMTKKEIHTRGEANLPPNGDSGTRLLFGTSESENKSSSGIVVVSLWNFLPSGMYLGINLVLGTTAWRINHPSIMHFTRINQLQTLPRAPGTGIQKGSVRSSISSSWGSWVELSRAARTDPSNGNIP